MSALTGVASCSVAALLFFFAVVDRIAVTVGNQVITETEILRQIALTAFLNGEKPAFTLDNKHKAAEQLVEQKLVHKEMDMGHYPGGTSGGTGQGVAGQDGQKCRRRGGVAASTRSRRAHTGRLGEAVALAIDAGALCGLGDFRPAILVTAQVVQDYYRREILAKLNSGPPVPLADVREQIMESLSAQRADQQLDEWLKHAKTTTRIDYKKEAFQ